MLQLYCCNFTTQLRCDNLLSYVTDFEINLFLITTLVLHEQNNWNTPFWTDFSNWMPV